MRTVRRVASRGTPLVQRDRRGNGLRLNARHTAAPVSGGCRPSSRTGTAGSGALSPLAFTLE